MAAVNSQSVKCFSPRGKQLIRAVENELLGCGLRNCVFTIKYILLKTKEARVQSTSGLFINDLRYNRFILNVEEEV